MKRAFLAILLSVFTGCATTHYTNNFLLTCPIDTCALDQLTPDWFTELDGRAARITYYECICCASIYSVTNWATSASAKFKSNATNQGDLMLNSHRATR